jgi:hypothetical protein
LLKDSRHPFCILRLSAVIPTVINNVAKSKEMLGLEGFIAGGMEKGCQIIPLIKRLLEKWLERKSPRLKV